MKTCKQCGQPMISDAPEGLCARCLLSVAMQETGTPPGSGATAPGSSAPPLPDFPDIGDAAAVARRLPQYEILGMLGRGGMGVVYQARQVQLDRIVALKILPPADEMSPDFVERFRREARSLAKLSHPNIVGVHDFGESGGLYYFAMEFVDGVNLREMIRSGKMKPEEALAVVPKICDALQFAHEEGVVHRDVKPENILIDKRGRVKIADFGLAKLLRREQTEHTLTVTGMTLGTPRYMAPEQLDKPESVDHRADIYSLGVVFYEMLTGEVPMGRFAPPSEKVQIDVRLDEIVLHALERDADRRYQHASQVRDDVEKVTSKPQAASASTPAARTVPGLAPEAAPLVESRLSRMALIGAIWALFGIIAVIPSMMLSQTVNLAEGQPSGLVYEQPPVAFTIFMAVLLFIGMGAPIGTTILGAISMSNIKKSGGKLYGLPLAFADTVFFPMLLLHGAMAVLLGLLIVTIMKMAGVNAGLGMAEMGLLAMLPLIADFFIVRALWGKATGAAVVSGPAQSVRRVAIWMIIGGIASLMMNLFLVSETIHNHDTGLFSAAGTAIRMAALVALAVASVIAIRGALGMLNLQDHAASRRAAVCSMFSPFGIITLPAGIRALVLLGRPEVKALFPQPLETDSSTSSPPDSAPRRPRHLLSAFLVLLCLFGFFFGFSFQAKHSGNAAGMTKIITIGALDPLYTSESGPSGFQTGFNFFSWSFFAVVVAGIAFGALWRIGREDQGKVPRDPAWWRDWWKQVGIWGGLLLTIYVVRTVMHPEKVLQGGAADRALVPSVTVDKNVTYLSGHTSAVKAVAVSPDGRTLVSAGLDGRVLVRDLPDGKLRRTAVASSHPKSAGVEQFRCAAILADNEHALVGGGSGGSDGLMKIKLFKNQIERLVVRNEYGASVTNLMLCDFGSKLAYLAGGTHLNLFDMNAKRLIAQPTIFPGKFFSNVRATAVSPDGALVAVTSSNMEPMVGGGAQSAEPCKLTVFDMQGVERLSWQFADYADFSYAMVVFTSTRTLAVCLPSGKMERWTLDDAGQWQQAAEFVRISPGRYTASAISRDGKIIWLAEGNQITGIDSATGKGVGFIELKIGERKENYTGFPIDQIAVTNDPLTIAAALWDGRVALAKCHPLATEADHGAMER